jgi:hypothetical protein
VQCLWQHLSDIIQAQRHTAYSENVYHDEAYKTTTKQHTLAKTAGTLYRTVDMVLRTDIKSEITNIVRATRHEAYA